MPKRHPDHQPERSCAVCRSTHPKREMTRLVRRADGSVAVDPSGKAAGRGTYLCSDPACREPAQLAAGIRRALDTTVDPALILGEVTHAGA